MSFVELLRHVGPRLSHEIAKYRFLAGIPCFVRDTIAKNGVFLAMIILSPLPRETVMTTYKVDLVVVTNKNIENLKIGNMIKIR